MAPGEVTAPDLYGWVIIEWPAARAKGPDYPWPSLLPGWRVSVYDAMTGQLMNTISRVTVRASAQNVLTAELTMFADAVGKPLPHAPAGLGHVGADGEIRTGTWQYVIAEMRIASHPVAPAVVYSDGGSPALAPDGEPW